MSKNFVLGGLLALCLSSAAGAGPASAVAADEAEWLTLGLGGGTRIAAHDDLIIGAPAVLLGGTVLRQSHMWTLRYTRVGMDESVGDVALLYDRVLFRTSVFVSAGAGVGLLYKDDAGVTSSAECCAFSRGTEQGMFDRTGFAWSLQATSGRRSDLSLGACAYGAVGGNCDFWALALVARIGALGTQ